MSCCVCNNCCDNLHVVNSATITGGNLVLTFADAPTGIVDQQRFCFRFGVDIPAGASALPVQVTVNGVAVPLWDKFGDLATGSDLVYCVNGRVSKRFIYKGYYGTATANHVIVNAIPLKSVTYYCPCSC